MASSSSSGSSGAPPPLPSASASASAAGHGTAADELASPTKAENCASASGSDPGGGKHPNRRFHIRRRFRELVIRHQDVLKFGGKHGAAAAAARTVKDDAPPRQMAFDDFEVLRAIGRGAFGKVHTIPFE